MRNETFYLDGLNLTADVKEKSKHALLVYMAKETFVYTK